MSEIDKKLDDLLQHHGVKGMHWGQRKATRASNKRYNSYNKGMKITDRSKLKKMTSAEDRQKYLDDKDKKWLSKVANDKKMHKVTKRTAKAMKKANKELKKQYGGTGLKGNAKRAMDGHMNAAYHKAMQKAYEETLADHTHGVYKLSPTRTREVKIQPMPDGTLKAVVVERNNPKLAKQRNAIVKATNKAIKKESTLKHSSDTEEEVNLDGMFFLITPDDEGFPDDVISPFDDGEDIQQSGVEDVDNIQGVRVNIKESKPVRVYLG